MIEKLQSVDIDTIISELKILPKFNTIICLQGSKETSDPMIDTVGGYKSPGMTRYLKEKYNITYCAKDFIYPLFDIPYINSIMENLKMVSSRILNLRAKTCYTYHQDKPKRINIPLITNENCWLIINKVFRK